MVKALSPNANFEYVLEDDRSLPEEEQTTWILRYLTVTEEAEVGDSMFGGMAGSDELRVKTGSVQINMLRKGLVGWRNFTREDGSEVTFAVENSKRGVKVELLDLISAKHRTELAKAIDRGAKPTVQEGN